MFSHAGRQVVKPGECVRGHKGLPWKAPEEMPLSYLQGGKCHYTSPASRTGAVVCFVGQLPCGEGTQLGLWKAGWNYCNVCCVVFAGWHLSWAAWLWDVLSFSRDGQGHVVLMELGGPGADEVHSFLPSCSSSGLGGTGLGP